MRVALNNDCFHILVRAFLSGHGVFFSVFTGHHGKYKLSVAFTIEYLPSVDDNSCHESCPEQEVEHKCHGPSFLPSRGAIGTCSWEKQKWDPDVEGVAKGHHRSLSKVSPTAWDMVIKERRLYHN